MATAAEESTGGDAGGGAGGRDSVQEEAQAAVAMVCRGAGGRDGRGEHGRRRHKQLHQSWRGTQTDVWRVNDDVMLRLVGIHPSNNLMNFGSSCLLSELVPLIYQQYLFWGSILYPFAL